MHAQCDVYVVEMAIIATYPKPLQGILIILVYKTLGTLLKVLNGLISPPFDTIAILVKLMT